MQPEQQELSPSEQSLRYTIAGILSTIPFVPAQSHPTEMLTVSDLVIRTVKLMDVRGDTPALQREGEKPF